MGKFRFLFCSILCLYLYFQNAACQQNIFNQLFSTQVLNKGVNMDRSIISGGSSKSEKSSSDKEKSSKTSQRTTELEKPADKADQPPILNLKRHPGQSKDYHKATVDVVPVAELDCGESYFMSPNRHPVEISLNSSVYSRKDANCRWNFIGTEPCVPVLNCDTSQLTKDCDTEYLEIVDGVGGAMKICGGNTKAVTNTQASKDLRDLYLRYKAIKPPKDGSGEIFSCKITCGKRGEGTPLTTTFESKMNPKCMCGTKPNEDRIMNGENAQKFEYPWLVALIETNTRQPFCGGSIINNRFIQTAGHCIKGKFRDYRNIQVMVNGHFMDMSPNSAVSSGGGGAKTYSQEELERLDKGNGSRRYNVDEVLVHPLYVSENNDFDIALLKLTEDIDLKPKPLDATMENIGQQPRAICLPPLGSYLRTYANKKAIIAGWGLPGIESEGTMQILQKLPVHVFSPKDCKEMFAHRVNRRMLCAGYREGGKDSCAGDSGGPLVLEDRPKVWIQIGSVSFGEGCGEEAHPGVYFRTTEGVQWITYNSNYNAARADEPEEENKSAVWCITPP